MDTRTCNKERGGCGKTKPITEFQKNGKRADGSQRYQARCNDCLNAARRESGRQRTDSECVNGCGRRAKASVRGGQCPQCYNEKRYDQCIAEGCAVAATGNDGFCSVHRDLGACEHEDGCDKRGRKRIDGVLLCNTHYGHAKGYHAPAEHDRSNDPHVGYVWRWSDGKIAYVGITSKSVERRTAEHRMSSWWVDRFDVAEPDVPEAEFDNKSDAESWERDAIVALTLHTGTRLLNTTHNPHAGWWDQ